MEITLQIPDTSIDPPPRKRRRWLIGLLVVLVVLSCLGSMLPTMVRDLRLRNVPDISEPFNREFVVGYQVADADNAFVQYRDAAWNLVKFDRSSGKLSDVEQRLLEQGWNGTGDEIKAWLAANQPALSVWEKGTLLHEALEIPLDKLLLNTPLPTTEKLREFTRLAVLQAARMESEGRLDEAWDWHRALLRCSRHSGMGNGFVQRVVGFETWSVAMGGISRWAADARVTSTQLRGALNDVDAIDRQGTPLSTALATEYVICMNSIENQADSPTQGRPHFHEPTPAWKRPFNADPELARRVARMMFANWKAFIDVPIDQQPPVVGEDLVLYEVTATPAEKPLLIPTSAVHEAFARIQHIDILPTIDPPRMLVAERRDRVRVESLKVVLAAQIYYRERGEFPLAVDELVPYGLRTVPRDPFVPSQPLRYRRSGDLKVGAVIWSTNDDGVDDEGEFNDSNAYSGVGRDIGARIQAPIQSTR